MSNARDLKSGFSYFQRPDGSRLEPDRAEMLEFIPSTATRILDVGCYTGAFGRRLKQEREIEVWGIELEPTAVEKARNHLDKVLEADFVLCEELPLASFDCVVFNDVLEHLVDPFSALLKCRSVLKPGGLVVASIPNVRYFGNVWSLLVGGEWKYADDGVLSYDHLRFFTKSSMRRLFEDAGFEVKRMKGLQPFERTNSRNSPVLRLLNLLAPRRTEDMRWMQIAVIAENASG